MTQEELIGGDFGLNHKLKLQSEEFSFLNLSNDSSVVYYDIWVVFYNIC